MLLGVASNTVGGVLNETVVYIEKYMPQSPLIDAVKEAIKSSLPSLDDLVKSCEMYLPQEMCDFSYAWRLFSDLHIDLEGFMMLLSFLRSYVYLAVGHLLHFVATYIPKETHESYLDCVRQVQFAGDDRDHSVHLCFLDSYSIHLDRMTLAAENFIENCRNVIFLMYFAYMLGFLKETHKWILPHNILIAIARGIIGFAAYTTILVSCVTRFTVSNVFHFLINVVAPMFGLMTHMVIPVIGPLYQFCRHHYDRIPAHLVPRITQAIHVCLRFCAWLYLTLRDIGLGLYAAIFPTFAFMVWLGHRLQRLARKVVFAVVAWFFYRFIAFYLFAQHVAQGWWQWFHDYFQEKTYIGTPPDEKHFLNKTMISFLNATPTVSFGLPGAMADDSLGPPMYARSTMYHPIFAFLWILLLWSLCLLVIVYAALAFNHAGWRRGRWGIYRYLWSHMNSALCWLAAFRVPNPLNLRWWPFDRWCLFHVRTQAGFLLPCRYMPKMIGYYESGNDWLNNRTAVLTPDTRIRLRRGAQDPLAQNAHAYADRSYHLDCKIASVAADQAVYGYLLFGIFGRVLRYSMSTITCNLCFRPVGNRGPCTWWHYNPPNTGSRRLSRRLMYCLAWTYNNCGNAWDRVKYPPEAGWLMQYRHDLVDTRGSGRDDPTNTSGTT